MTTLMLLIALTVVLLAASIRAIRHDSRGTLPPPSSRYVDRRFLPPSAR